MPQSSAPRLSNGKYTAHTPFSQLTSAERAKVGVNQLRALVWYHVTDPRKGPGSNARLVDPRKLNRLQLLAHASGPLDGHMRRPPTGSPDMEVITTQYNRDMADDALVETLLASLSAAPTAAVANTNRRSSRHQERTAADRDGREEGEEADPDPARSDADEGDEGEEGGEDEEEEEVKDETSVDEPGRSDDSNAAMSDADAPVASPPRKKARGRPTKTAQLVATVQTTGAKKAPTALTTTSKPTKTRVSQPMRSFETRWAHCMACTLLNNITDRMPSFCSDCGSPWGVLPPNKAGTKDGPGITTTTTPTPTTWAGASSFTPKPISALVPAQHSRQPGLAPLDEKIIDLARKGKQFHTLADLLQLRAEDRSTTTSVVLSNTAILFDPSEGSFTSATGAAATSARTAAARRRTISGFAEIAEVILFSLIGTIYVDRPDIGQQLIGLLIIAQDLTRSMGWQFALDYIDRVRLKFYNSHGGPVGRHCLDIHSSYDMGQRDIDVLIDTKMHHLGGKENGNPNRGDHADKTKQKSVETCRGYNTGTCGRKAADCKWTHRCSTCQATGHPASQCTTRNRAGGGAATATAGAARTATGE
jgi:hypothetical protein